MYSNCECVAASLWYRMNTSDVTTEIPVTMTTGFENATSRNSTGPPTGMDYKIISWCWCRRWWWRRWWW